MFKGIFYILIVSLFVSKSTIFCNGTALIKMVLYHNTSKPLKIKSLRDITHELYIEKKLSSLELKKKRDEREVHHDDGKWKIMRVNVEIQDVSEIDSFGSFFEGYDNIIEIEFVKFPNKNIKNYSKMFKNCYALERVDISCFSDVQVKFCSEMFYGCSNLETIIGLKQLNMHQVKDISGMFQKCCSLKEIDLLGHWDLSNVKTCQNLFSGCKSLKTIKNIDNLIHQRVENISGMFEKCYSLTNLDLHGWDTSNIKDMSSCFEDCTKLEHIIGLAELNLSNVENLHATFSNCKNLINIEHAVAWKLEKITNISYMFNNCLEIKDFSCKNWHNTSLKNIEGLFCGCKNIVHISGLEHLDVKNVTSLSRLFYECEKLEDIQNITAWNVKMIENIDYLFYGCKKISSLDLSKWSIPHLKSAQAVFAGCESLQSLKLGQLDFSSVKIKHTMLGILLTLLFKIAFIVLTSILFNNLFKRIAPLYATAPIWSKCVLSFLWALAVLVAPINIYAHEKATRKPNKLKYLSFVKTVFPVVLDKHFFCSIFGFFPTNTKLITINTSSADNIHKLYPLWKNIYFCCNHWQKNDSLRPIAEKNNYNNRIISCSNGEVDVFFDDNINLPYEELKEKFEQVFTKKKVMES